MESITPAPILGETLEKIIILESKVYNLDSKYCLSTEEEFKIMEQNADKVELKTNALALIAMEY